MPDPVDWGLVLESPIFWGAVTITPTVGTMRWPHLEPPTTTPTKLNMTPKLCLE